MLRIVLGDYLDNVKERAFDLPLISLLPTMGFYDVHFTHGQVEFGKDIIAKRIEDGIEIQYSFQSKAGDISQSDWRNDILGQVREAVFTKLSHPQFDSNLPHQTILVTTGRLKGNTALAVQEFNIQLKEKFKERPIIVWERENLLDFFEVYSLSGIHQATAADFTSYGSFYLLYGAALRGSVSTRDIEQYSRQWLSETIEQKQRLLRAAIEAETVSKKYLEQGFFYEAIYIHFGTVRVVAHAIYDAEEKSDLLEIYDQATKKVYSLCQEFVTEFQNAWEQGGRNLLNISSGLGSMMSYLVQCSRIIEITGLLYFLEQDGKIRSKIANFLQELVSVEPGCGRPSSDQYAVSLVLPVLVFYDANLHDAARAFLQRATVWLCDRFQEGMGLAGFEANEYQETVTLLGTAFDFIPISHVGESFVAAAVSDLAAFLGNHQFYSDVINDIKACKIIPTYWQPADTKGMFSIDSDDVVVYPNIEYADILSDFCSFDFAEHIRYEPRTFTIVD